MTCCNLPRGSVKRRSTYLTSLSLIAFRMSLAVFMITFLVVSLSCPCVEAAGPECDRRRQMASAPVSPVRMRIASSMVDTKILPSPMRPVCAALRMASTARGELFVGDDHLDLDLGQEVHDVLRAAVEFGLALLPAEALGLEHRHALDARSCSASFTSSSLNGLMIASIFFMVVSISSRAAGGQASARIAADFGRSRP